MYRRTVLRRLPALAAAGLSAGCSSDRLRDDPDGAECPRDGRIAASNDRPTSYRVVVRSADPPPDWSRSLTVPGAESQGVGGDTSQGLEISLPCEMTDVVVEIIPEESTTAVHTESDSFLEDVLESGGWPYLSVTIREDRFVVTASVVTEG